MLYRKATYRVSAKALIKTREGLVLVKEDSPYWDLPGGGVEHFEDPLDTLSREIEEEVGVKIQKIDEDNLRAWATYDKVHDRPLLFLVYSCKIEEKKLAPPSDIEVRYFSKGDLKELPIEPHLEKYRDTLIAAAS